MLDLGAHVVVTSRSRERAEEAAGELAAEHPEGSAQGLALDTGDLDSIAAAVDAVSETLERLDVLVNNAGALTDDYRTDARGNELTLSTHLLGPYLLTTALRPHLTQGARVLWMSSGGMYTQRLVVDELEMSEQEYRGAVAYARAKRAQVELVTLLGPQWAPEVIMHAAHPGWVDTPGVEAGLPGFRKLMGPTLRGVDAGADTMVWLAATGGLEPDGVTPAPPGSFWHDRRRRSTTRLPRTATDDQERRKLVDWLEAHRPRTD
jgi:NAD(P)-dependent dehydrogenase (short-subunit alcohol dehydrogenase family)